MSIRKIINDPVHSFISINDDLIYSIVSHPYFQRLRRIKQMAMAYLVYPGAVHTRLQHSLGAYHLVCLAIDELRQKGADITEAEAQATKIAILLHDVGHGPFSHALEETLVNIAHEDISILIMQQLNKTFDGQLQLAIDIFLNQHPKKYLHQLVSSQLDCDRLDYLARDSFFTGVSEGVIGYDRIIKMLAVHNNELVVEEKGIHSIEKFLISRSLMYWQVYLHKTVLSSEALLVKILERAKYLATNNSTVFASPALQLFLNNIFTIQDFENNNANFEAFLQLDDYDILSAIKVWMQHDDKILSDLSTRLINRNLYKTQFESNENAFDDASIKQSISATLNIADADMHYYFLKGTTINQAYNANKEPIKILFKNGELKDIMAIDYALINSNIGAPVKKYYICFPKL
jgi:uncharacterized protein